MIANVIAMVALIAPVQNPQASDSWEVFPGDGARVENGAHVHDPTIVEIGGKAFCFSTSGDGFTIVRSSTDLKNWKVHGPIFTESPKWLADRFSHKSIWAPDIVVLPGRVRMYYSKSTFGSNTSVIGLAENENFNPEKPLEGWVDRGMVIETKQADNTNAIDAEVIVDKDGRHWFFYGSYWDGIYVLELDAKTGKPKDGNKVCVARNSGERGNPLEGAAVLRRGDYYYLFVSYGLAAQGVRSTYRIMCGRSKTPNGPFLDKTGKSMADGGHVVVLKTSPPMMSPGHCDVLTLKDGRTVMPYHYYDARQIWHGDTWGMPQLQVRELLWSEDGWPLPGNVIGAEHVSEQQDLVGTWLHQDNFGQPMRLELKENGEIAGERVEGKWHREGSRLTLTLNRIRQDTELQVQLAYGNSYYVGRNAAGNIVRGSRVVTGFKGLGAD